MSLQKHVARRNWNKLPITVTLIAALKEGVDASWFIDTLGLSGVGSVLAQWCVLLCDTHAVSKCFFCFLLYETAMMNLVHAARVFRAGAVVLSSALYPFTISLSGFMAPALARVTGNRLK